MSIIGIIAEFNPLHNGHKFLIDEAKKSGTVVCVISGNFVQRGDTAIVEKRVRAEAALKCGADLCIELPVCYSMSTAQNFAFGAVSVLAEMGCDTIMFGSECGDVNLLKKAANILISDQFSERLKEYLKQGITFAAAREKAAKDCGFLEDILNQANNNLAIEYIIAALKLNKTFDFKTVTRKGASHDSKEIGEFVSASLLREKLLEKDIEFCKEYMPLESFNLCENLSDIKRIENLILGTLRTKTKEELSALPDVSEGLENKLYAAIKTATSLHELYDSIKVKRYTHARIRRLVLSAFLGLNNNFFMKKPSYIRVLGFNKNGEEVIKKQSSNIPIVVKATEIEKLCNNAKEMFEFECKATDLYSLSLKNPLPCGIEYTANLIKMG